jgi:protoporphyrinogen oxidase
MNIRPTDTKVVIVGGGPAGLTCAHELQKADPSIGTVVFEAGDIVGGIARTESHRGYRFDIGGHRFFTKVKEVESVWDEIMGDDFITVPRLSRIYYRDKFYDYPLKPMNALRNIGLYETFRIMLSLMRYKVFPHRTEETFEHWVVNRFGYRLYAHFFKSYTEKVWGVPCSEIRADWAAQRIKNLSLFKAVWNAFTGSNDTTSLIEEFKYPRLGPGQMWEKMTDKLRDHGGEVHLKSWVKRVMHSDMNVTGVEVCQEDPETGEVKTHIETGTDFINTMPLRELLHCMDPAPPAEILAAADKLKYRDFMIVTLVLDHEDPFPDNWIYVHSAHVHVGRIQNFRAWSKAMIPEPDRSSIGMEYFCNDTDALWSMPDEELIKLAGRELEKIGLAPASSVVDGAIIRQPKAYPVYDSEYQAALDVIKGYVTSFENFQTVGRNGLHRYNNQDHSMLSAMLAARNILGEMHDVWEVNVERSYHEEFQTKPFKRRDSKIVAAA